MSGESLWGISVADRTAEFDRVVLGVAPDGAVETQHAPPAFPPDVAVVVMVILDQDKGPDVVPLIATADVILGELPTAGLAAIHGQRDLGVMSESEFRRRSLEGECAALP